jgi:eukaryotic-like serine/threonine-protein kinase
MPIQSGTHLGPYEILSAIGAGGMGEVYEARDTKLGRSITIKVLPPTFVDNAERVARFQREARMLASLNHPNIATIHGFEESGGRHYLVMELPGQTLAERLSVGALETPEALAIARQIALALETAHEQGVIHRDLKPANIKVTPDGRVPASLVRAKSLDQFTMLVGIYTKGSLPPRASSLIVGQPNLSDLL